MGKRKISEDISNEVLRKVFVGKHILYESSTFCIDDCQKTEDETDVLFTISCDGITLKVTDENLDNGLANFYQRIQTLQKLRKLDEQFSQGSLGDNLRQLDIEKS